MKNRLFAYPLGLALTMLGACSSPSRDEPAVTARDHSSPAITSYSASLPLSTIALPAGFHISIYAEVDDARSMVMSDDGTLFVGNRSGNKVYAVRDTNNDFMADKRWVIASGLNMPNGVALRNGDLYVSAVTSILRFPDIENHLADPPKAVVVTDSYPPDTHHGWKYIAFGPDGKLYVPEGAPCNICKSDDPIFASITRMNPDGTGREIFAEGVRNTVGFTWHPVTHELWFTDNGRDMLGDDVPPCELNYAPHKGMHFGYPYCHGGTIKDPEYGNERPCSDFTPPAQNLGPHVAPLGVKFYTGTMFPEAYRGNIFIAEHGSWNRSKKIGYRVSYVTVADNTRATGYSTFASGWLNDETQSAWGRPVDLLVLPDGSMLLSDDQAGIIYRITYQP